MGNQIPIRALVVGEDAVGKTSFCRRATDGEFPDADTLADDNKIFLLEPDSDDSEFTFCFVDTDSAKDRDEENPENYESNNIVLLCYSIDSKDSLEQLRTFWAPKVKALLEDVPLILVGLKMDTREENADVGLAETFVTTDEGTRVSEELGCAAFYECSALSGVGVGEVMQAAKEIGEENAQAAAPEFFNGARDGTAGANAGMNPEAMEQLGAQIGAGLMQAFTGVGEGVADAGAENFAQGMMGLMGGVLAATLGALQNLDPEALNGLDPAVLAALQGPNPLQALQHLQGVDPNILAGLQDLQDSDSEGGNGEENNEDI